MTSGWGATQEIRGRGLKMKNKKESTKESTIEEIMAQIEKGIIDDRSDANPPGYGATPQTVASEETRGND